MEGDSLPIRVAELARLGQLIQGLVVADILLFEEGDGLLRALASARSTMDGGEVMSRATAIGLGRGALRHS